MLAWMLISAAVAGMPSKIKDRRDWSSELWSVNCRHCHGERALGDGALASALEAPALAGLVVADPETVALVQEGRGAMPAFRDVLDRGDTWRVLEWLEALDSETGKHPAELAEERKKARKAEAEANADEDKEDDLAAEDEAGPAASNQSRAVDGAPAVPPPPPLPASDED